MHKFSSSIFIVWIALASALPAVGRMHDLVLCFSSQGHVAIESEHAKPSCADICDSAPSNYDAFSFDQGQNPHSCFDFVLSRVDMRPDRSRTAPAVMVTGWTPSTPTTPGWPSALRTDDDDRELVARPNAESSRCRGAQLRALRTVILRV